MLKSILVGFEFKYKALPSHKDCEFFSNKFTPTKIGLKSAYTGIMIERLRKLPQYETNQDILKICEDVVTKEEVFCSGQDTLLVRSKDKIPSCFINTVKLCTKGTLLELVDLKIIPSAEALAPFLPSLLKGVYPIRDPSARLLASNMYTSFRIGRRTLVLHAGQGGQVRIEELPWFSILMRAFSSEQEEIASTNACRKLMHDIGEIIITRFPGSGVPNKIQQDMNVLLQMSGS
jgi:hypothetical protein